MYAETYFKPYKHTGGTWGGYVVTPAVVEEDYESLQWLPHWAPYSITRALDDDPCPCHIVASCEEHRMSEPSHFAYILRHTLAYLGFG